MSWLSKWFINNPVAANLLMAMVIAGGLLAFGQLRVESFPQIAPSSISIQVAYPGGTARQIDESITQRVEESVSAIAGIKQITSQSQAGLSTVTVRKKPDADYDKLLEDIRNQVNTISHFPAQAEKPIVTRDEFTNLAAFVIVSAPRSDDALQQVARQVELALKKHPDISSVSNWGAREPRLFIEPQPAALLRYGMTIERLASAITQASLETRSGQLKHEGSRITLRGDGYINALGELRKLPVINGSAGEVTLGEIATVRRGYEQSDAIVRNNGMPGIALMVSTSQSDNLLDVSEAISDTLAELKPLLAEDIIITTMADMAPYIEEQLERLGTSAWQGLLIVIILLGIFLNLRLAFWVAAGIPVAICGTLYGMQLLDYSLNDITLFGFILVLGILVDDAVVVGEAIDEHQNRNSNYKQAAYTGVESVTVATVFGVLTSIAAFSPMLWINNDLAKLFAGFSAVVILALCFSLVESKFILPSHLAAMSRQGTRSGLIASIQSKARWALSQFILHIYTPALRISLRHKRSTLVVFLSAFILAYGLWLGGAIRSTLFPEIPGRYVTAKVTLEEGAPLGLQVRALSQLELSARATGQALQAEHGLSTNPMKNILAWSNGYGDLEVTAELTSGALNALPANTLSNTWRKQAGKIEGNYAQHFSAAEPPAGGTFLAISSPDGRLAKQISDQLRDRLTALPGVKDARDDYQAAQRQIRVRLNAFGRQLGLTQSHIAELVANTLGEREVHRLLYQSQELKVVLRFPQHAVRTEHELLDMRVMLDDGQSVALGDVAELNYQHEPQMLQRRDRERVINLYWSQDRAAGSPEQTLDLLQSDIEKLTSQFPQVTVKPAGEYEEIEEVNKGFKAALILTLMLIYVLLAIPLKSYWQPLIIMAVIPFGFAGAIFGHAIMGLPVSLLSLFGMMAMTGIVVNDALVLITRFNTEYRQGITPSQALLNAGTGRFRAIFLTTITTVCGLLPLLFGTSEQVQYLKPAAVSLVFGELFATLITLFLIPVLLGMFHRKPLPAAQSAHEAATQS
ncbi:efflux RND transporter permease subunit [Pseudoalteromonas ardens]|uniref:Acriflavine resistance protein B n=1 Tax=Pseudoalteromonas rubra TaxID=43658 RepID=A0A0L0EUT4_9GAMM|nr:efflux RND transporter permease subunit [Pseudoalteromonas sp. R96]KNC67623.1 acriflavine resistance protein B [Pseudoalteromonas rubra]MDK1310793.1 efflux RND transporter permease subunit [Pseudoalteromonas sp. R96]